MSVTTSRRAFGMLLIGRVLQAALGLLAIRILTNILDKENVGLTYLVTSLTSYFSLIFINPVGMYFNRKLHAWFHEKKIYSVLPKLNIYFLLVAGLSIPVVTFSYFVLNTGNSFLLWQICLLIAVNLFASTWFQTLAPSLNMLEHRGPFVGLNLATQALGLIFSTVGVWCIERSAFVWLMGLLCGQVIGATASWFYFRHLVSKDPSDPPVVLDRKEIWHFCFPIAITTAFMWAQTQSYRIIIESQSGAALLATLAVGLGVSMSIAGLVESLVNQYFYPRYYATISREGIEARSWAWQELFLNALAVYIPTTVFVLFLAKFILKVLVGPHYDQSVGLVMWGAVIEFFRMTTNIVYAVSQSEMKTRRTILPYGSGALLVVVGVFLSVSFGGDSQLVQIPAILGSAGLLVFTLMYWNMKKILPLALNFKFMGLCFVYSIPFCLAGFFDFKQETPWLSLGVCGLFGIYLLWVIWRLLRHRQAS